MIAYQIQHDGDLTSEDVMRFRSELMMDNLETHGAILVLTPKQMDDLQFDWVSQTAYARGRPELPMESLFGFTLVVPRVRFVNRKVNP